MNIIRQLDDDKLVAGGWHNTQFFDIKEFKAETNIKNTFTEHANAMIRMGIKSFALDGVSFLLISKHNNYSLLFKQNMNVKRVFTVQLH